MPTQSCKLCHFCGEKMKIEQGKELCPNDECKTVQVPADHSNLGITTCQFARLLSQMNVMTHIHYRLLKRLEELELVQAEAENDPSEEEH